MYKKTNSRRNFIKKSVVIPSIIILPRHVLGGKTIPLRVINLILQVLVLEEEVEEIQLLFKTKIL